MSTKPFMRAEIKSAPPQKVPRTLADAFGPYASRNLLEMPDPPMSGVVRCLWWAVGLVAIGALIACWLPQP